MNRSVRLFVAWLLFRAVEVRKSAAVGRPANSRKSDRRQTVLGSRRGDNSALVGDKMSHVCISGSCNARSATSYEYGAMFKSGSTKALAALSIYT